MSKSWNFSVYLLKENFNDQNALKDDHKLKRIECSGSFIPEGGAMYYGQNQLKTPWWKDYWGISENLQVASAGAIVFLPVHENRCFAITFGSSYHSLRDDSYEYDFGLKTTLNALDPEKIKSTDLLSPETSKRQRIQSSEAASLTFFDFNSDETIIKRLTGAVKNEYQALLKNITGSTSLRFSSACQPNELPSLCSKLLKLYKSRDFETSFPGLQSITPIKDPSLINELDKQLLEMFRDCSEDLTLGIPDIIDYSTSFKIRYKGLRKRSNDYQDVYIGNYREYIGNLEIEDVSTFKKHFLCIVDENEAPLQDFSIYKSFLLDCQYEGKTYHLCEGNWYEIDSDFVNRLQNKLDGVFVENHDLLLDCEQKREDEYNVIVEQHHKQQDLQIYCLDKKSIAPQGQKSIEPCDLLVFEANKLELIHNKISTRSSSLSHLFNQGVNSITLLLQSDEARENLGKLAGGNAYFEELIKEGKCSITYGIITNKDRNLKSTALPLFSRLSLSRCTDALNMIRIPVKVFLIRDLVDRKQLSKNST